MGQRLSCRQTRSPAEKIPFPLQEKMRIKNLPNGRFFCAEGFGKQRVSQLNSAGGIHFRRGKQAVACLLCKPRHRSVYSSVFLVEIPLGLFRNGFRRRAQPSYFIHLPSRMSFASLVRGKISFFSIYFRSNFLFRAAKCFRPKAILFR